MLKNGDPAATFPGKVLRQSFLPWPKMHLPITCLSLAIKAFESSAVSVYTTGILQFCKRGNLCGHNSIYWGELLRIRKHLPLSLHAKKGPGLFYGN